MWDFLTKTPLTAETKKADWNPATVSAVRNPMHHPPRNRSPHLRYDSAHLTVRVDSLPNTQGDL